MGSEATGASSESKRTFKDGAAVRVRGLQDKKEMLAAVVVRQHRNGDYTVKYVETGNVEKQVASERLEASGEVAVEVGDSVQFQVPGAEEDAEKWREGCVKLCRKDGSVDILDAETDEVVKKVALTLVKLIATKKKPRKSRRREEDAEIDDAADSENAAVLEENAAVQFKNPQGVWCDGRVCRVRSNGTYDIALESDEEDVAAKVERRLIRPRKGGKSASKKDKKAPSGSEGVDASEDEDERRAMRKRKSQTRKSRRQPATSDEDDTESADDRAEQRHVRARQGRASRALPQLRVGQVVDFEDKSGRMRRGRIKLVRKADRACDVEHESDPEVVSKRVSLDVIRPVSTFGRLFSGPNQNRVPFQLNTHVFYRGKDGLERKGIVLKVWREGGKTLYDVEDLQDGSMLKQLSAGKLRAVPWLDYSLPSWNWSGGFPSFPSFSLLSSPILRRGVKVRFRRRHKETGRISWKDGVIVKAKSGSCCLVEFFGPDGEKERITVKNSDIQARFPFQLPFSGMLDGMLDGLNLPSIQLPVGMFKVGSAVEVASGSKVFLGSIVSANELDKTYTIKYDDGRKEKNVVSDRVRLSLRRLRIGTEVEMIVEGPCKEVSKLDGEVAWVHRDEKVAVRINGGNNDVFAEVCSHALMVDGKPAFTAPLSSTWLELWGYYCNLAAEVLIYLWFFFGMLVEMDEMLRLHEGTAPEVLQDPSQMITMCTNQLVDWGTCSHVALTTNSSSYLLIPADVMATDRSWLAVLVAAKAVLTACCAVLALRCLASKLSALQDDFIDLKEYQQERVMRRHLALVMGTTLAVSYLTLACYVSLLNRFDYYCLLDGTLSKALRLDQLALHDVDPLAIHTNYDSPVQLTLALAGKATFNLFRGVTFHLLLFAFPTRGTDFIRRVLLLLPSIAMTALFGAVGTAALHILYYVQKREMLADDALVLTTPTDLTVLLLLLSLWLLRTVYSLAAAAGSFVETRLERQWTSRDRLADDVLELAERGEFGLQAQREALVAKVEQRQDQLGLFKLSLLRVHRHALTHLVAAVAAIYIDATLRSVLSDDQVHAALTQSESDAALQAVDIHLGLSITWLIGTALAALYAIGLRQQAPELMAYILDV